MELSGFLLQNPDKIERAIHGILGPKGALIGGVGENADPAVVLAEYDRLGGLILKNGRKVKTGSFYDFKKKAPREKPEIMLVFRFGTKVVEMPEGEPLPLEIQAQEMLEKQKATDELQSIKKSRSKKAAQDDLND